MELFLDINSYYGTSEDNTELLCADDQAIVNGFINLINTNKDMDGISERVFRPNVGTTLLSLLDEPMDDLTVFSLKSELANLAKQISRAEFDSQNTTIVSDTENQQYIITIALVNKFSGRLIMSSLIMPKLS